MWAATDATSSRSTLRTSTTARNARQDMCSLQEASAKLSILRAQPPLGISKKGISASTVPMSALLAMDRDVSPVQSILMSESSTMKQECLSVWLHVEKAMSTTMACVSSVRMTVRLADLLAQQ